MTPRIWIALTVLLVTLLTVSVTAAQQFASDVVYYTDVCYARPADVYGLMNARSEPSLESAVVGYLREPAQVIASSRGWYQVGLENGVTAWVAGWLVRLDGECG